MSKAGHILVVDRERRVGDAITAVLRRPGWSCHALGDARQVADALRKDAPDVLVVDLGVAAYRKLLARRPKLPPSPLVPVATGGPSLSLAVEVLNLATVAAFLRGSQLAIDTELARSGRSRHGVSLGLWGNTCQSWAPSACRRLGGPPRVLRATSASLVQPADSSRWRRFRGRRMSSGDAPPPTDFRT